MENIHEKLNAKEETIASAKGKVKFQGKRWFLFSYLGMIIAFIFGCVLVYSIMGFLIFTPPLGASLLIFINLVKVIYTIFIFTAFILGRVLKKRSLYFSKGFTYGGITIIIMTILLYIFFNI